MVFPSNDRTEALLHGNRLNALRAIVSRSNWQNRDGRERLLLHREPPSSHREPPRSISTPPAHTSVASRRCRSPSPRRCNAIVSRSNWQNRDGRERLLLHREPPSSHREPPRSV